MPYSSYISGTCRELLEHIGGGIAISLGFKLGTARLYNIFIEPHKTPDSCLVM